jgi:addiction module HigA family antidote
MLRLNDPVHPGALIKEELGHLGNTKAQAAEALDVTRKQLHKVITGRSSLTPEMALRLEKAIGSTADTWLQMQTNYDLAQIRKRSAEIRVMRMESRIS